MTQIDCTKALVALYQFLDGELTESRRETIEGHLNGCSHCFSAFDFEVELRTVVRSKLQTQVPNDVRLRVMSALMAAGCPPPRTPDLPSAASFSLGNAAPPALGNLPGSHPGVGRDDLGPPRGGPLTL